MVSCSTWQRNLSLSNVIFFNTIIAVITFTLPQDQGLEARDTNLRLRPGISKIPANSASNTFSGVTFNNWNTTQGHPQALEG